MQTFSHTTSTGIFSLTVLLGSVFGSCMPAQASTPITPTIPHTLTLTGIESPITLPEETLAQWFTRQASLTIQPTYRSEIENTSLCPLGPTPYCDLVFSRRERLHTRSITLPILDEASVRATLQTLNDTQVAQSPIDARFAVQDGRVIAFDQHRDGRRLDIDQTVKNIRATLNQPDTSTPATALALESVPATVTSSNATALGIVTQIAEGRTNFAGSPRNRIHNFTLGASRFNGVLIAPGEEFSFVDHLGEVDGEHGYLPELVIKQNVTTPEFGGGICQVSSTAFRAALNAGLKITMRRNHAYPVSYYKPYGMDATIYIPRPDLRFVNNTPGHILIQTAVEGSELIFRLYGTDDGRHTTLDGPHILAAPGDGSMKTVFTQTVTTASGQTLIDEKFYSNYKPASQFPHPGEEPAPEKKSKKR